MPKKILVVDDEMHIRMLLEQALEDLQDEHEVAILTAADGRQALEVIHREMPDLVFLDVMMPHLDGFAVCRAVGNDTSLAAVRIILLTAKGQETDRQQGLELGAIGYITKPFDPDEILDRSRAVLELGEAR